mgnify:CR=1 FL=1
MSDKEKLNEFNIGSTMTGTGTVVVAFCDGDIDEFKHNVVSAVGNDEKVEIVFTKLKFFPQYQSVAHCLYQRAHPHYFHRFRHQGV